MQRAPTFESSYNNMPLQHSASVNKSLHYSRRGCSQTIDYSNEVRTSHNED